MKLWIRLRVGPHMVSATLGRGLRGASRQGTHIWTGAHPIPDGDVRSAVRELLENVPRSRWVLPPRVMVEVGGHASRVKHLRGLPQMGSPRMLEQVVRENAQRFFLWTVPFVTTTLEELQAGEAMGGVIEASVFDAIVAACVESGYMLRAVHPDGHDTLVVRPVRSRDLSVSVSRPRTIVAVAAVVLAVMTAVLAPGLAARRAARRAARELATLASAEHQTADRARDEQRDAAVIGSIARFEHERRSATVLLAALSDALPPESAITTIRADSAAVDLVIVSSRAAGVLGALDRVPGIIAPEIVGPISREVTGTRELERATMRFKYAPVDSASATRRLHVAYAAARTGGE